MFAEPVNICGEKILIIKWLQQKNASLHCVLEVGFELSQKIKHTPTQCILQHFYFSRNNGNFFCCLSLPETTCFAIKYLYSAICSIVLLFFFWAGHSYSSWGKSTLQQGAIITWNNEMFMISLYLLALRLFCLFPFHGPVNAYQIWTRCKINLGLGGSLGKKLPDLFFFSPRVIR